MVETDCNASELIAKGDVVMASGTTVEEVFSSICSQAKLPSGITSENLVKELMEREKVLSTAVGNGVAIPHPRRPLVADSKECCVIVAYLKSPLDMQAPDSRKVYAMFILLSSSSQLHVKSLASLAAVFRNDIFKKGLVSKPGKEELARLVQKCEVK
ncbi:PTS sugar transporter subunit IIA [Treponema sp.]|uniref:PTS sugar transporter subunit IIA n=1 Tax=Treponema sp. TaxID=166 RepID=UPI00298DFDF8|nr:PTS sugar transporter subunit IIA [Treponema sp.]MCQ2240407.1 PTS sugar transporter subunit IIA [Treponema sp.]